MSEYTMGGVTLEIVGNLIVPPTQPGSTPPWPTNLLEINTPVVMLNGALWRVLRRPAVQEDARYLVELRHPQKASQRQSFLVPAGQQSTGIWNTGQPLPTPPEIIPELEPIPVDPTPTDPPVNGGGTTPVEDPQMPVETP